MSEVQVQPIRAQSTRHNLPFPVSGRIESVRAATNGAAGGYFVLIRVPASDAYSMPSLQEISFKSRPGSVGDDWVGMVTLTGTPNNYETKAGEKVKSARNYLHAVE